MLTLDALLAPITHGGLEVCTCGIHDDLYENPTSIAMVFFECILQAM